MQGARFFSTPVTLGVNGVECINKFGLISEKEQLSLNEMLPTLKKQIEKGVQFAKEYKDGIKIILNFRNLDFRVKTTYYSPP